MYLSPAPGSTDVQTVRGWAALGASIALIVLWWAFGEKLLVAAGAFLALAVIVGSFYVRRARPRVGITRRISPAQLHDGDRAIVDLSIASSHPIRHVALTDEVHGLGTAQFTGDAISPGSPMVARYEILCRPRGVYRVGPAEVLVRGPMAMVESGGSVGKADRLVVYPTVEDLDGLPHRPWPGSHCEFGESELLPRRR